jgi:hypothetical protein
MALRRIPSRRMHERHAEPEPPTGGFSLGVLLAAMLALAGFIYGVVAVVNEVGSGVVLAGVGLVAAYVIGRLLVVERRRQFMADQRQGESICTFVRAFDCRAFDTWVLRATYEQLTECVGFSVRPGDRLAEDLGVDDEYDLDVFGETIARLAGREFDETRNNPWFGRVRTVADVCDFLMCRPRVSATAACD